MCNSKLVRSFFAPLSLPFMMVIAIPAFTAGPTTPEQAKLTASDGAAGDNFGAKVALSGDTAVVGALLDDGGGTDSGAAYVFVRSGTTWTQQAKLTASDAAAGDNFGISVALDGETALVGAYLENDGGSGSAYVFTRSGGTWDTGVKLVASDPAADDLFGVSVALDGETALVGAFGDDDGSANSGSAYVFTRSGGTWDTGVKLVASDPAAFDRFGISVAMDGETALVGAYQDDNGGFVSSGSAYVFTRTGGTWDTGVTLVASDAASLDRFGISVALDGETALVGAYLDDDGGFVNSGSAYVFTRSGGTWDTGEKLVASDPSSGDLFGVSVALDGDTALIGAFGDDDGSANSGSAYVFTRSGGTWDTGVKLVASDPVAFDRFGISLAMDGETALVGAYLDDDAGADSGSAYVFVPANAAPDCSGATPSEASLFPPNHTLRDITFTGVTDTDGDTITITVDSIFQDEAVDAPGTGNTAPDGQGFGTSTAEVRAERAGGGNGRVYIIELTADDGNGGSCPGVVLVGVPQNKKDTAVDDGALFDSTVIP